MFEKEAEEWFDQSEFKGTCSMGSESFRLSATSIWQKGAEFGYNKGKHEAKEIIRSLLFHLSKDTFAVIYETKEESIEKANQFLSKLEK